MRSGGREERFAVMVAGREKSSTGSRDEHKRVACERPIGFGEGPRKRDGAGGEDEGRQFGRVGD